MRVRGLSNDNEYYMGEKGKAWQKGPSKGQKSKSDAPEKDFDCESGKGQKSKSKTPESYVDYEKGKGQISKSNPEIAYFDYEKGKSQKGKSKAPESWYADYDKGKRENPRPSNDDEYYMGEKGKAWQKGPSKGQKGKSDAPEKDVDCKGGKGQKSKSKTPESYVDYEKGKGQKTKSNPDIAYFDYEKGKGQKGKSKTPVRVGTPTTRKARVRSALPASSTATTRRLPTSRRASIPKAASRSWWSPTSTRTRCRARARATGGARQAGKMKSWSYQTRTSGWMRAPWTMILGAIGVAAGTPRGKMEPSGGMLPPRRRGTSGRAPWTMILGAIGVATGTPCGKMEPSGRMLPGRRGTSGTARSPRHLRQHGGPRDLRQPRRRMIPSLTLAL